MTKMSRNLHYHAKYFVDWNGSDEAKPIFEKGIGETGRNN